MSEIRTDDQIVHDVLDLAFLTRDDVSVGVREWKCCGVHYVDSRRMARVHCLKCGAAALLINSTGGG